jgi:hypothetical protein
MLTLKRGPSAGADGAATALGADQLELEPVVVVAAIFEEGVNGCEFEVVDEEVQKAVAVVVTGAGEQVVVQIF